MALRKGQLVTALFGLVRAEGRGKLTSVCELNEFQETIGIPNNTVD